MDSRFKKASGLVCCSADYRWILILILFFQLTGSYNPFMLIFYGLGLVNAEKFTFNEIFYLGYLK